jgi:hypothetical protein
MREYSFAGIILAPALYAEVSNAFYCKAVMRKCGLFYLLQKGSRPNLRKARQGMEFDE